jgi:hypothetical protein
MADIGKKISAYNVLTAPTSNTFLVVSHNGTTYRIGASNLFANNTADVSFSNTSTISINNVIIRKNTTPANSTITITEGSIWFDDDYIYCAIANNSLKRIPLESF